MEKVLLVDDDIELLNDRSQFIKDLGYNCYTAKNGAEALKIIRQKHLDIILTDMKMPDYDGFAVLKFATELDPDIPVIMFTAFGSVESAVHAMKLGAYDFIQKPVSPEMLEIVLKKAIEYRKLKNENIMLKRQIKELPKFKEVVCNSRSMLTIVKRLLKVAETDTNVFIYGETGTGKEMIARLIHSKSFRKNEPFIPLDCVALPATLLESEIFGFEKGAFTGAIKTKPGILELADGGTLFLDEIAELDPSLQAKLLRVLQEHQFRRLGGTKFININIRIISATNQNPEDALKEKKLREDLYYRLNVVPILMPPLRNRKEDIPQLVQQFIDEFNPSCSKEIKGISEEAMMCLKRYNWPGNVRELKNVIQQAISLTENNIISANDLPEMMIRNYKLPDKNFFQNMKFKEAKQKHFNQFSKAYFDNLLSVYDNNISKVAEVAGISRKTLYRILNNIDNI